MLILLQAIVLVYSMSVIVVESAWKSNDVPHRTCFKASLVN